MASPAARGRVGVDTGGTFTDVVSADGLVVKVPSTPDDPARAVRDGLGALASDRSDSAPGQVRRWRADGARGRPGTLAHGTTVATNALLERRGARVALVTTTGLADVIEIGRQDRPSLYDPFVDRPDPLVDRCDRHEVGGRRAADGSGIVPLDVDGLTALDVGGAEVVAVCLLHSDLDPTHEQQAATVLRGRRLDVTCSCEVSPLFREYERTATTVVNAYLRPVCGRYLRDLAEVADEVLVMSSAGGLVPLERAAEVPAGLLLSGPAGGVAAAAAVAAACGHPDAVTFDMGGTSTDVCLVRAGAAEPAGEQVVAGLPVRLPSLDVHTIGAGGGSIAAVDAGGALTVGPRSAGAVPGPACYGRGGDQPTVTDADLVAGRLAPDTVLPGLGPVDVESARRALDAACVSAAGVIEVVEAAMEQAVRAVTVARGVDPRRLALVAFGGAGPLHACGLADALGMATVIVPPRAGVLSAVGMLCGVRQHDLVAAWPTPADHTGLDAALTDLGRRAVDALRAGEEASSSLGVEVVLELDCRYVGQSHELRVATVADFHAEHQRRNGYTRPDTPVEVVALRATARRRAPLRVEDLPVPERGSVVGPAVIREADCTVYVADGWRADPGPLGALVLTRTRDHPAVDAGDRPAEADGGRPPSGEGEASTTAPAATARRTGDPVSRGGTGLDPAALAVLMARLTGVAQEVGAVLQRGAFSPNIKERADCSAALFTADGTLLVQAEHIPVHLGSMPASVAAAIAAVGRDPRPGSQVIVNDPFAGGTHLNDVTLVAPCHASDGRLVGWVANRAHHADLGGAAPGSLPADATEIQQEGLRIPPVLFTPGVRALLVASSRTPDERGGDIDAQVGANVVGVARMAELADEPLDEVIAYGERRMRAALAELADGSWRATDVLDSFGSGPDQRRPTTIRVEVRIDGDHVTFDFTGSDPQRRGNVNAVEAVTVSAAVFALRSAIDPTVPANGGGLRAVSVQAPPGSVVAAQFPAAVGAGNVEVSQRVADVCLAALAGAVPERIGAASQGTMNNLLIGGDGWVFYETVAGGQGGRPGRAGMSGVHTGMTNTRNTPIEALERAFPLRVEATRLRRGSGGEGRWVGGDGIERTLRVLEDCTVSLITERRTTPPAGLAGGGPGAVGDGWLLPGGDEARAQRLADKCTLRLAAGDVLRILTPGGGGWGSPKRGAT